MRHSILTLLLGLVVAPIARSQGLPPGEIATLKPRQHHEPRLVAFSPDGRLLASAGGDHDIRIWDVSTARRLYTLKGHSEGPSAIAFSPDGKLLASAAGVDVRLWDVQSGRQQGHLEVTASSGGHCLAFRPDGKRLVGAGASGVTAWDTGTGKVTESDKLDNDLSFVLSADGGALARLASARRGLYLLRVRDLAAKKEFDVSSKEPFESRVAVALSRDGRVAAIGDKLWDVATDKQLVTLKVEALKGISRLTFSPDGKFVAAVGNESSDRIGLYEVKTGKEVFVFKAHEGEVYSLAITRNGQTMASVSADKTVKLWDLDP